MSKISRIQQILLLCARRRLDPLQSERLTDCLHDGVDWRRLLAGASANLILPLMSMHVLPLLKSADTVPFRDALTQARNGAIQRMLHISALKQKVLAEVFNSHAIRFFELKGSVLSMELYGGGFIRQFRDIDLLVEPRRIEEAAQALLEGNWRVINKEWDINSGRDLSVLSQYQAAIELCSPSGVVLELHRTLDNSGCVFNTRDLFWGGEPESKTNTLPKELHLVYMLFHHSRHRWSSLHWVADARMFSLMPQAEIDAVRRLARRFGLQSTADEALRLIDNLDELAEGGRSVRSGASRFYYDCLGSLCVSAPDETAILPSSVEFEDRQPDFAYAWQETRRYRLRFALSRFRPSLNDYDWLPLRRSLRWVYWITKPWRVLRQKCRSLKKA